MSNPRFTGYLSNPDVSIERGLHAKVNGKDLGAFISIRYSAKLRRDVVRVVIEGGRGQAYRCLGRLDVYWDDDGQIVEEGEGLTFV
jgi:hypothetical protein